MALHEEGRADLLHSRHLERDAGSWPSLHHADNEPGPDIAPYHDRQIVILERSAWAGWLDPSVSAKSLIKPLPAGTLAIDHVG